jgi:hypothetical protein
LGSSPSSLGATQFLRLFLSSSLRETVRRWYCLYSSSRTGRPHGLHAFLPTGFQPGIVDIQIDPFGYSLDELHFSLRDWYVVGTASIPFQQRGAEGALVWFLLRKMIESPLSPG